MIQSKADLKRYLEIEKPLYWEPSFGGRLKQRIAKDPKVSVFRFVKTLRKEGFHHNQKGLYHNLCYWYYHRKRNTLGLKLGLEMWDNTFAEGLYIAHAGNIVVNGKARVGKNCILHGSNCIGNRGIDSECPVLGNNVRLGVGAKVIGGITLADDITVAAGAVVTRSFFEPGITVAGIPAQKIKG